MTVNVNIAPTVTASSNSPVCTGSALSLTGEPASMTTYAWTGPNAFSNATQSPTVSPSATTAMAGTYSLTVTDINGCSGTASTIVTVNVTPTITSTTPASRCGTGTVTLGAAASAGTINWYAALTGGASLGTGTSFTTPSISGTTTYYVDATVGSCTSSPRIAVTATVNTPPSATAGNNGPVCSGTPLSITGGPGSLTSYAWSGPNSFSNATQSPAVSASATAAMAGTYTITVTDVNGCSGTASTVVVVNTTPTITSTTPAARCGTCTVNLGAASSGTINWYAALTGGASLGTGTSFTTPSISATTTYYVDATSGSCTSSPRTAVTATVNTPPTATASNNGPVCSGSTLSLTGGPGSLTSYAWSGPNSFSSATQSPTVSTTATTAMAGTYIITVTDANGCSGTASTVAVVNATPTITSTTPASRCGTGTVTLGAAASAGTINWYAALTGGASLGTGTSYTTPSVSATTTYYVAATNAKVSTLFTKNCSQCYCKYSTNCYCK